MGAATIATLHSNAEFPADIKAARKEVKAAKAKGISACFLDALSDNDISRCNRLPTLLPSLLVIANIDPITVDPEAQASCSRNWRLPFGGKRCCPSLGVA